MSDQPLVALAMARRGQQVNDAAAEAFYRTPSRKYPIAALCKPVSTLLPFAFNQAWVAALNTRDSGVPIRYFAMIHDDIAPDPFWVDTLIDEMQVVGADVISAIVPIKDHHGLTSTAVYAGDIWCPRRLTMTEVMDLPETIGRHDVEGPLLLNTGLWVADLECSWVDDVCFDFLNRIRRTSTGERVAQCVPEDWLNSHKLNELGARLFATRKVKVRHEGATEYPNDEAWGSWRTDELWQSRQNKKEELVCS